MHVRTLFRNDSVTVIDYRCTAGRQDAPFVEQHAATSMSYVRRGTFGYRYRGDSFELAPGAMLIGQCGDEFVCTHEHHGAGDECLSFHLAPTLVDSIAGGARVWRRGYAPPTPQLMVLVELAQAAAEGASNVGLDEIGVTLAARLCNLLSGRDVRAVRAGAADRRRATEAALWIDANAHDDIDPDSAARHVGLSAFHFLPVCARTTRRPTTLRSSPTLMATTSKPCV